MRLCTALLLAAVVGAAAAPAAGQAASDVPASVPRNGLVGFWTADGHAKDSLGKHHGTIHGNVKYTTGRNGKAGGAFLFDGKNGFIRVPDSAALDTDKAFTLAAWINPKAYKDEKGYNPWLVSKYYGGGIQGDYALCLSSSGQLSLTVWQDMRAKKADYIAAPGVIPKNKWTHVAASFDRGRLKIYVSGKLLAEKVSTKVTQTDPREYTRDDVWIGALWDNNYNFDGAMDEVGIWNRALMGGEIATLAGLPPERPPAYLPRKGLVAFWTADGHAKDSLGKHHGTLHGNVKYTTGRHGKANGAFLFDSKKGFVKIPDRAELDTDHAFTVSAWINPRGYTDQRGHSTAIVAKWYSGDIHSDYAFFVNVDGRLWLYVCAGPRVYEAYYGKSVVPKNTWTHVAATFNAGTINFYINGRLDVAKVCTKVKRLDPAEYKYDDVHIGALFTGDNTFNGALDEVGIWNRALSAEEIASTAGPMAAMYVVRLAHRDRVEMNDSSVLRGGVQNKQYTVATPFGKLAIPAEKVVGILPAPKPKAATTRPASQPAPKGPFVHLLLADGQVVTGSLAAQEILLATDWGPTLKVPIGKIRQCGFRIDKTRPAEAVLSGPVVTLRGHQQLCFAEQKLTLPFQGDWGKVDLPVGSFLRIEVADWQATRHKVHLANGSVLTGTLPKKWKLKLALGPEATIHSQQLWGLTGTAEPTQPGPVTMLLRSGDRLTGRLAKKTLVVRTASGEVKVHAPSIVSMEFNAAKRTAATLHMWDNKVIKGTLTDASVAFEIMPGAMRLKVPAGKIASVTNSDPVAPPDLLQKVEKLIAQLGAESYQDREKAQAELIKMGKRIVPLLKKHANNPDPEIRQRLANILKALGG